MELMHRAVLDQDEAYVMLWEPKDKEIIFEVQVRTQGYVGLGFSPNGGMKGADVVLGWVADDGKVMLQDCYATDYTMPKIDKSQDVELLGGYQNDTHTVLRFSRPLDSCDADEDRKLTSDTIRLIWAYGREDPDEEGVVKMHDVRGTKSLYLMEPRFNQTAVGEDVRTWEVMSPNVTLPDNLSTLYWCKMYKIPRLARKNHIIGYVPVIQKGNEKHVHHILLYECHVSDSERHFEKWLDVEGAQCYGPNMPVSWYKCNAPLIAWAVGSEGEMFPEHAGFPLGEEHGGATYLMMEIHYDNPQLRKGVADGSGLRILHTERTRAHDAGVLQLGHYVTPLEVIPPRMNWLTVGHCSADCLADRLPAEGVRVFQGVLHAHVLGREINLRHIRDGQELPPVFADNNYDFNYQQARVLQDEVAILRGDSFITECRYDSRKRSLPTFGGFGTEEEMCLAFLSYYPRLNVSSCLSRPSLETLLGTLGVEDIHNRDAIIKTPASEWELNGRSDLPEEIDNSLYEELTQEEGPAALPLEMAQSFRGIVAKSPEKYANMSLYDILKDEATWEDFKMVMRLQDEAVYSKHVLYCGELDGRDQVKMSEGYPDFVPYWAPDTTCGNQDQGTPTKGRPFQPHSNKINVRKMLCPSDLSICKSPQRPLGALGNRPIFF
ncbi:DBH-like monooxygenase protein 1 [Penaeus chinensis]|uniref:DBH-like monooxygenase protein 1 n=1 Tax=Penaeus chinensis TaxID=139456 RepID=UPI001FB6592B|nr:DBH-like monooxygenase protein 1 [Penaeus chinensis]